LPPPSPLGEKAVCNQDADGSLPYVFPPVTTHRQTPSLHLWLGGGRALTPLTHSGQTLATPGPTVPKQSWLPAVGDGSANLTAGACEPARGFACACACVTVHACVCDSACACACACACERACACMCVSAGAYVRARVRASVCAWARACACSRQDPPCFIAIDSKRFDTKSSKCSNMKIVMTGLSVRSATRTVCRAERPGPDTIAAIKIDGYSRYAITETSWW
jgi:hypothetical protein